MAEAVAAISLGASVLQFIDVAGRLLARLREFYNSQDVPQAFQDIADFLPLLLCKVEEIRSMNDDGIIDEQRASPLTRVLDGCQRQVIALNAIMTKCLPVKENSSSKGDSRLRIAVKAFRSLHKEKDVLKIRRMLQEYETTLIFYFSDCSRHATAAAKIQSRRPHRYYEVPGLSVTRFIGREALMRSIQKFFSADDKSESSSRVVVLHGMGGQGKTQVALEYCRLVRSTHSIFWFDMSSPVTAVQCFHQVAYALIGQRLPPSEDPVKFVLRHLNVFTDPFQLVFDNFDCPKDFEHISAFMPQSKYGNVLVTSRHKDSGQLGELVEIPPMSIEEGTDLLFLRSRQVLRPRDRIVAGNIVGQLGGLALAIDQAGSYMNSRNLPIGDFLSHFNERRESILKYTPAVWPYAKQLSEDEKNHKLSAFTTWELSILECGDTEEEREPYIHFLTLVAYMDASTISEFIFELYHRATQTQLPSFMRLMTANDGSWDPYKYQDMIVCCLTVSLVQSVDLKGSRTCFSLHPLVAEWLRLRVNTPSQRRSYTDQVIGILRCITDRYNSQKEGLPYLLMEETASHIQACSTQDHKQACCDSGEKISETLADAAQSFAAFLRHSDKFDEAELLLGRALECPPCNSNDSSRNSKLRIGLGELYLRMGKITEAAKIFQQTLAETKEAYGADHLQTLRLMNCMAKVYVAQHQHAAAKRMYRDALYHGDQGSEEKRALVLELGHGLAQLSFMLRHYGEAYQLTVRVLKSYQSMFGRNHIRTLVVLNDLANVCCGLQLMSEAGFIYRELLAAYEGIYVPNHTTTLTVVFNLSLLCREKKDFSEAKSLGVRALQGRESILGITHYRTLEAAASLIVTCLADGDMPQAFKTFSRFLPHVDHGPLELFTKFWKLAFTFEYDLLGQGLVDLADQFTSMYNKILHGPNYAKEPALRIRTASLRDKFATNSGPNVGTAAGFILTSADGHVSTDLLPEEPGGLWPMSLSTQRAASESSMSVQETNMTELPWDFAFQAMEKFGRTPKFRPREGPRTARSWIRETEVDSEQCDPISITKQASKSCFGKRASKATAPIAISNISVMQTSWIQMAVLRPDATSYGPPPPMDNYIELELPGRIPTDKLPTTGSQMSGLRRLFEFASSTNSTAQEQIQGAKSLKQFQKEPVCLEETGNLEDHKSEETSDGEGSGSEESDYLLGSESEDMDMDDLGVTGDAEQVPKADQLYALKFPQRRKLQPAVRPGALPDLGYEFLSETPAW